MKHEVLVRSGVCRSARAQAFAGAVIVMTVLAQAGAQAAAPQAGNGASHAPAAPAAPAGVALPAGYVIGPDDILIVTYWRDKDMSSEVIVRPDGQVTVPLLNDVRAAGLTPEQLREKLMTESVRFVADPNVTVVVKEINSRKVFVTGQVSKPGPYPLTAPTTVVQLLAVAGGVHEFADTKNIRVLRVENGRQIALRFNYKDVAKGKNLGQNIELKPGDTVIVP